MISDAILFKLATVLFVSLGLTGLVYSYIWRASRRRTYELNDWLIVLTQQYNDYQDRLKLLDEHTDSYIHSLGETGVRILVDTRTRLEQVKELLLAIANLLDLFQVREVESFKNYLETKDINYLTHCPNLIVFEHLIDWNELIEANIQLLGGEIAVASKEFHSLGVQGTTKKRKTTSMSLKEARIKIVEELENQDS